MKRISIIAFLIITLFDLKAQDKKSYINAFDELTQMLKGSKPLDFKRAVFITENAYYADNLDYKTFCGQIIEIEKNLNKFIDQKGIRNNKLCGQFAIFSYMMEPSPFNGNTKYSYDFDDLMGKHDYTKMFVTKLLKTKSGNCHSLPFLFKILADELHSEAYLALGPNHLYIKHQDDKGGWVNVELTNGSFPRDSWVISSLSITTDAIKSDIYMKPLTQKESVALCLFDLACGYQFQFGNDDFGIKCCDTLLYYFPKSINANMLKSEIMVKQREKLLAANNIQTDVVVKQLEKAIMDIYKTVDDLGYKGMPKEQYEQWLKDVEKEKTK